MKLFLSSERNEQDSITIFIEGIFQKEIKVNYVLVDNKIVVIPTGKWIEEIMIYPFVEINKKKFIARLVEAELYRNLFIAKYGKEHFNFYFSNAREAVVFEEYEGITGSIYEFLGKYFDTIADKYYEQIQENKVQFMMRKRVIEVLDKYVKDEDKILDLGSGSFSEVIQLTRKVSVTEVDVSKKMIEISMMNSNLSNKKVDYILLRDINDIKGEYDVIFSSFGFLNIESTENIRKIVKKNLREGGYFIGAYMNKFFILEALLNLIQGRLEYTRNRFNGKIGAAFGRYGIASQPRGPSFFKEIGIDKILMRKGICTVLPPYNYRRLNNILEKIPMIFSIDNFLSSIYPLWVISDFIIFVGRKQG